MENNIIRKSYSTFASPAFPLLKRNGQIRLVIDYRDLNKITVKDAFLFPDLHAQLQDFNNATVFSSLDMNQGYYTIHIREEDIHKTAFVLPLGHFEFLRMPFGLTNAPRTFQKAMKNMLEQCFYTKVFLDDVFFFSKDTEEHKAHLHSVLDILEREVVSINFEKSQFFKEEIVYLCHIINKKGIREDPQRSDKLPDTVPKPKNIKELRSILGLINWFRPYVVNLSSILNSVTDKTKRNSLKEWKDEDSISLENVIKEIKRNTMNNHADYSKDFELWTDASDVGISAILKQEKKIIGIYSSKFSAAKKTTQFAERNASRLQRAPSL